MRDHLVHARLEVSQNIPAVVFDTRYKKRRAAYAVVREDGVCAHHLADTDITRPETKRHRGMYRRRIDAVFQQQLHKLLRVELRDEICRYPVVRLLQSPFQRHILAISRP